MSGIEAKPHWRRRMKLPAGALGAALAGLSNQRAIIEAGGPLARCTDLTLRLEAEVDGEDVPELYAKVIRALDESRHLYMVHFTSASPALRMWLSIARSRTMTDGG